MDLPIREEFLKRAVALHKSVPVVDAHLDLAGEILLRKEASEKNVIRNHYLKKWKSAGINLIVSSVYVPAAVLNKGGVEAAWENALKQIDALKEDMENTEEVMPVRNREELRKAAYGKKTGILVYMEGLDCIGGDLDRLKILHDLGVRGASLTWSRKNALAVGCCRAGEKIQIPGGLTEKGREAIEEMERLSMFLDVSHLNDDGFEDVKQAAKKPFCATHSCARSVYDNYRNLTDEQMKYLAGQGGVMGLNGCKYIAGSMAGNHLEMLCRHAEYEVRTAGENHVGFGFDLCDSYEEAERRLICKNTGKRETEETTEKSDCFSDHGQIPLLTAALLQRGMEEKTVTGISGGNFLRFFESVLE